ncbi:hypothetical protein [Azospirillum palustre]
MTDLRAIVEAMLRERSLTFGFRYPADAADRLIAVAEAARKKTAHREGERVAGIKAMDAELERIEQQLFS